MSSNQARELPEPDSVTAELIAIYQFPCHGMELLFFFVRVSKGFAFESKSSIPIPAFESIAVES